MDFLVTDFSSDSNPRVETAIGRNRYILLGDLLPLLSLSQERVLVSSGEHSVQKPAVKNVVFEAKFFSNLFQCSPPSGKSGCTCCAPIRGVGLYGMKAPASSISHELKINGTIRAFSMFKGSCPLFKDDCCSLGGSAETFYKSVPLPCAISPGWSVSIRGNSAFLGRKVCRHGKKISYSEDKLKEDSIVLERIASFLRSLSLGPAFSASDLRRAFEAQPL